MTAPSICEAVARALALADGQNPDRLIGFTDNDGNYDFRTMWTCYGDGADAALAVALPILREHFAGVVEAWAAEVERKAPQSVTIVQARMHASHIRADEGPK